jgi:hypothetical protein
MWAMSTTESAKKICVMCGQDVSGKPRVKDALGSYLCAGECEQRSAAVAKARAAAPRVGAKVAPPVVAKPVAETGGTFMSNLIDDSPMMKATKCDACGQPMSGSAVLCTRCGFNTQTGKALKTAVVIQSHEKQAVQKTAKSRRIAFDNGWVIFGVAAAISIAAGLAPLMSMDMALPGFVVLVVVGLAAFITVCSTVYSEGSSFMILVFITLRILERFLGRMSGPLGPVAAGVCEIALVVFVLIFVDNPLAKALTGAACLGGIGLGVSLGVLGKSLSSVINL